MSVAVSDPVAVFAPRVTSPQRREDNEVDWAIAAAVAAIVGIVVAIVIYICSVCDARSFWACMNAVREYFTPRGC